MDRGRRERILEATSELCLIPGLSGHEGRVAEAIGCELERIGLAPDSDVLGNIWATADGSPEFPSILLFAHMDQLGFIVRKIENDGRLLVERVGGVPEKALQSLRVVITAEDGTDLPGFIASKSHHATLPQERVEVVRIGDLHIEAGFESGSDATEAGVRIGSPVVYRPWADRLGANRLAGSAIDDRAGCAVLLEAAREIEREKDRPTVHYLFSVQEEFNLRGALPAVRRLNPEIAVQIDLALATDTPEVARLGDVKLGEGPCVGMHSFHGRGTLNGLIPHPALVRHFESCAADVGIGVQRSVHMGALTETAYVQLEGSGIACLDVGFPMRYSHTSAEVCDLRDLSALAGLLARAACSFRSRDALKKR